MTNDQWLSIIDLDYRSSVIGHRSSLGRLRLPAPPEPAEGVGQDRAAVLVAVEAVPIDELVIIFGESQRLRHLLVGERPVAVIVVEVVGPVLEEDADRLPGGLADQGLVVVAPFSHGLPAGDIG